MSFIHSHSGIIDRNLFASNREYKTLTYPSKIQKLLDLIAFLGHEHDANFRYKLIEINAWYGENIDSEIFSNETKLQLPVTNVIVSHTRGDHCYTTKMCSSLINNMIVSIINFLIIIT